MSSIGVLALQGAFAEHVAKLEELGASAPEIRQPRDLAQPLDGLIIPGGESTVIAKLLRDLELFDPILSMVRDGLPVLGTCAGLILLAAEVTNCPVHGFGTMDLVARRNAYGRQLGSFSARADFAGLGVIDMTFIRAPQIESVGPEVEVLAQVDGRMAAARQGSQLVTAFHPELSADTTVHEYFLEQVVEQSL